MIRKILTTAFFILLSNWNIAFSKETFFKTCGVSNKQVSKIEEVLKNSNSRFIPNDINDIDNENFRKALYMFLFYRDNASIPDEFIELLGIDDIAKLPSFKKTTIKYLLHQNLSEDELKDKLKKMPKLTNADKKYILESDNFDIDKYPNLAKKFLKDVINSTTIPLKDLEHLIKKYPDFISDKEKIQQIRLKLYHKQINEVNDIKKILKNEQSIKRVERLVELYKILNGLVQNNSQVSKNGGGKNSKNTKSKGKNAKGQKNAKTPIRAKINIKSKCTSIAGYDEYSDLVCLEKIKITKDNYEIIRTILQKNLNPSFLPSKWLKHRQWIVREMMDDENLMEDAYDIIANAGKLKGGDLYTQQFLAGFISYIRGDFENALLHFEKCAKKSKNAEYNAKANYWLGLSYRKLDKEPQAVEAFTNGKKHPFTMYGQLASEELEESAEKNIENYLLSLEKNKKYLCEDTYFILGYLEQYSRQMGKNKNDKGTKHLLTILHSYVKAITDRNKLFNAINIIEDDFNDTIAKSFAFYAFHHDVIYGERTLPVCKAEKDGLVNAVIKKETNFKQGVIGSCGERGLMQIMPSTGKVMAKELGMKYDRSELLHNEEYNVKIGHHFLKKLLTRYDSHKPLAVASYNAGAGNVEKWIKKNGDPRKMETNEEVAIWIEKIPFAFTRSYVVNILGNEMTYEVLQRMKEKQK